MFTETDTIQKRTSSLRMFWFLLRFVNINCCRRFVSMFSMNFLKIIYGGASQHFLRFVNCYFRSDWNKNIAVCTSLTSEICFSQNFDDEIKKSYFFCHSYTCNIFVLFHAECICLCQYCHRQNLI